jgi:signal transduction histidine kinase
LRTEGTDALRSSKVDRFRNIPIKQKLLIITELVTITALLLAGAAIFLSDALLFHGSLQRDLTALAQITADDTTAAVAFDDPRSASETLSALRVRSHIISACIYRANGSMLAHYVRPGSQFGCPPPNAPNENGFIGGNLTVSRPILLQNRRIGTFVLLYDRGEVYERMRLYGAIVLIVLLASSFVSFLVSSRLRGLIATPILELARASAAVSQTRDYSIRARKLSGDELGTLVETFNEMLSGIQARDAELRKALAQIQEANENLARSNEDLERFAFVASHDLQEPLRMISIYSQLLVKKTSDTLGKEALTFLDQIVGGASRMRDLLSDLLAYTQIGARPDTALEAVDLNLVLDKVQNNLKVSIEKSRAVINADILPTLLAHEAHFIPLFQNLIGNAIKYQSDHEPPRVDISFKEIDQHYRFEVLDNGMGIAPEYHKKIFVPFKRLHGKAIPGTGIGLAICHRIVERYGGSIWVESRLGQGSKFIFTLPKSADGSGGESKDA